MIGNNADAGSPVSQVRAKTMVEMPKRTNAP